MMEQQLDEETYKKAYDARMMRRLLTYARPYWHQFMLAGVLLCAITCLEQAGPYLTKVLIDEHIAKGDIRGIFPLSAFFLATVFGVFILQTWQTIQTAVTGQNIMLDLRRQLFAHVHSQPLRFFDKNPVGGLMNRVITDVETMDQFFTQGVVAVFNDFFTLLAVGGALMALNWKVGLASLVTLPFLVWSTLLFRGFYPENFRRAKRTQGKMASFLTENLAGMGTVQAFRREETNAGRFDGLNSLFRDLGLQQIRLNALFLPVAELLAALSIGIVLLYGGWLFKSGGVQVGAVVARVLYVTRFFQPLRDLADKYQILQNTMASCERLFGLMDRQPEILDPADPRPAPRLQGAVEFEHVWFAYQGEEWVLKDLSFKVKPGERLAVVGPTGAGKTSLVSILLRFYPYQQGRVLLDGIPIDQMARAEFRRQISLVLQEQFLFSGSVLENVRLSDPSISREQVVQACQEVQAHDFISALPDGYDSQIGERGGTLSAGQRQLLAFARALVFNPRLLILDEATAQVDPFTEHRIQQALDTLLKGRTSVTIAHRLATITQADRILVIQGGRLIEQGNHAELMKQSGLYKYLIELQFQET